MNRVVVTGVAGHLGSHLVPLLVEDGFEVKGLDVVEPKSTAEGSTFVKLDLADLAATRKALEGAEFVVHCASIYPRRSYTDQEYIDSNIKGTWNVYTAAAERGIDRIVLTSSVNAVGNVNIPWQAWPVREEGEFTFGHLYCVTKHTQEAMARHFADQRGIRTISLRPSTFGPTDAMTLGAGLLNGRCAVVEDMAAAHRAATRVMAGRQDAGGPLRAFEAFNTTYQPPYTRDEAAALAPDVTTLALARKHWPREVAWFLERGGQVGGTPVVYDNAKAKRLLGWQAAYTFEKWFANAEANALRRTST